ITLLDGTRDLAGICEVIREQMNINARVPQLVQIVAKLDSLGLIAGVKNPNLKEKKGTSDRGSKKTISLWNPDHFLTKANKQLSWVFTKTFILISLFVMILVMAEMFQRQGELILYGQRAWATYGFLGHLLAVLLVASVHEIGHGL